MAAKMTKKKYKNTGNNNEDHGKHYKLTEEDVADIVYLYCEQGIKQKAIAEHYGVSPRTIQYILNPESRKKNYERAMDEDKEQHRERMRNIRAKRRIENGKHRED